MIIKILKKSIRCKVQVKYIGVTLYLISMGFIPLQAQNQKAIDSLSKRVKKRSISDKEKVDTYLKIVDEYAASDSLNITYYSNKALELAKSIDYLEGKMEAQYRLIELYIRNGITKEPTTLFSYIEEAERINYLKGQARGIYLLGVNQFLKGEFTQALSMHLKSLEIIKQVEDDHLLRKILKSIGNEYKNLGDYDKALMYFQKTLKVTDNRKSVFNGRILNRIGDAYYRQGDYDQALHYLMEARDLFESFGGNRNSLGGTLIKISGVYSNKGELSKALEYCLKALELREKSSHKRGFYRVLNKTGEIYYLLGDYEKSLEYYTKVLEFDNRFAEQKIVAEALNKVADIHKTQKEYELALDDLDQSLKINKELGVKRGIARCLYSISNIHYLQKSYSLALDYGFRSLQYYDSIGSDADKSFPFIIIGRSYYQLGNYSEARTYLTKAISIAIEKQVMGNVRDAAEQLATLEATMGDYRKAHYYHNLHKQVHDSLFNHQKIMEIARIEAAYEFNREKDSIEFAMAAKQMIFDKDIEKRAIIQQAFLMGIFLLCVVVIVLIIFYQSKRRANDKLLVLNKRVQKQNDEVQSKHKYLTETLQKLRITQKELVQKEKMASLGILSAGIAHEIYNPLNYVIKGQQLIKTKIKKHLNNRDVFKKDFEVVEDGVERIRTIIESLRGYSYERDDNYDLCDVHEIIGHCLNMLESETKDKITVYRKFTSHSSIVSGNSGKLHQAFLNILHNAVQAIEGQGVVTIETKKEEETFQVSIIDTGMGIPNEHLKKIGDPFFTSKPSGKGTGLGLYFTFDILKSHKATYRIQSREGIGTEVMILFPLENEDKELLPDAVSNEPSHLTSI